MLWGADRQLLDSRSQKLPFRTVGLTTPLLEILDLQDFELNSTKASVVQPHG